ncbi:ester cyclase [Tropicimonas sediminicola]|uniref:Predicted ester cyclase n=1 Tax=Tropicimonas sediminicola TaxID=1031541 RepID=A0A239LMS0_9RHOB|nr:ester cyclase [Tropicimonas sediminicola]SNT31103.1 Predicted ester cyclase [Tropicimonas sediminicola]
MTLKTLIASAAIATLATGALATGALADDTAAVTAFYDLLSNPGSESHVAAFVDATAESWTSVGNYSGQDKTRDAFLGQMGGFAELIPDLNWAVQDIHQDGEFVTVRSRATGTPVAPFFGVDGQGRSFDIMTIDIHELEDGQLVKSWHVEDWAGALQQLSGK